MRVANGAAHHARFQPEAYLKQLTLHTLCNLERHSTKVDKKTALESAHGNCVSQYGPAAPLMLPSVPTLAHVPGLYLPRTACVFAAARFLSACCAAASFSFFAEPRHNARFLKSLPVRERQSPWQLAREKLVHLAQVDGRGLFVINIERSVA